MRNQEGEGHLTGREGAGAAHSSYIHHGEETRDSLLANDQRWMHGGDSVLPFAVNAAAWEAVPKRKGGLGFTSKACRRF